MREQLHVLTGVVLAATMAAGTTAAVARGQDDDANFCMDVEFEPFHLVPGYVTEEGACAVRDYWDGRLQEKFYPFTIEDHLLNCDYYEGLEPLMDGTEPGDVVKLPIGVDGVIVPSSVASMDTIVGTIDGHEFEAKLFCASQTNWYQDSCSDPADPTSCTFQLAQPFFDLMNREPYPRVTEVSIFDGVITVEKRRGRVKEIPVLMATRAAGITHLEDLTTNPPLVGASVTHSLLGLLTYAMDTDERHRGHGGKHKGKAKVLEGSADLLLQGHIFSPKPVEDDPGAAVIKGAICSKDLYRMLNRKRGKKHDKHDD